jgi:hypothetical protein
MGAQARRQPDGGEDPRGIRQATDDRFLPRALEALAIADHLTSSIERIATIMRNASVGRQPFYRTDRQSPATACGSGSPTS